MAKSGAFRKKKNYFTQVSNSALRDDGLSLKAKGLYALISSYITLEDFTLYKEYLKKQCLEGEKAFESTWKELKEKGYLVQYRFQNEKTKQFYYEYDLLEESDKNLTEEIHSNQNRKKQEEKTHNPKKADMDKTEPTPPQTEGMDNRYTGKRGLYTNTNLNNTNTSSSKKENDINIFTFFEENICELRKTTSIKFAHVVKSVDVDFLKAVIEECTSTNVKSYKGFEVALQSYLDRNCKTTEDVITAASEYREIKQKQYEEKKTTNYVKNKKSLNFNNYEQRECDYENLEQQLRAASMGY